MSLTGAPRSPSFAPSSTITIAGRCCFNALAMRCRPPVVVSPLMLAFTTLNPDCVRCNSCCNKLIQLFSMARPYPADRLSPNTRMFFSACALNGSHNAKTNKTIFEDKFFMAAIVQAINLSKQVASPSMEAEAKPLVILHEVNFSVEAGDSLAILGASGSGKSTLLGLLAGLDAPSSGTVHLDGVDIFSFDEDGRARLRGRLAGFVFQSFQLLPALTALENVMLPLELHGAPDARERASEACGVLD